MTGMNQNDLWPNFLIIGAGKSGTTSLYHYLKSHPEVFMPDVKEPQHFSETLPAYASQDAYLALFRDKGDAKAWGESSVAYFSRPTACKKIHDALGDRVKMICLLRDPIRAIYSRWGQLVKMRLETRGAEEAILSSFDLSGWEPETDVQRYVWAIDYATHLERFYSLFAREQLKVFLFEEFFQPGLPQYGELCRFLGVSDLHQPSNVVHNKGQIWKAPAPSPVWGKIKPLLAPLARALTTQDQRARIYAAIENWNKTTLPPLSARLEAELKGRLSGKKRDLEALLGRDLSKLWA